MLTTLARPSRAILARHLCRERLCCSHAFAFGHYGPKLGVAGSLDEVRPPASERGHSTIFKAVRSLRQRTKVVFVGHFDCRAVAQFKQRTFSVHWSGKDVWTTVRNGQEADVRLTSLAASRLVTSVKGLDTRALAVAAIALPWSTRSR